MALPSIATRAQTNYDTEDDDVPRLSNAALEALMAFQTEQQQHEEEVAVLKAAARADEEFRRKEVSMSLFQEDWQLSQFWYNKDTSKAFVDEALREAGSNGLIVCISTPTAFVELQSRNPPNPILLLEYDERFAIFADQFSHYDYNKPLEFNRAEQYKGKAAFVICDPPFLEMECLQYTIQTAQYLLASDGKVLISTGQVMQVPIRELIGARPTTFYPEHEGGLSNEFRSYVTYPSERMPWAEE